jgi:hypothetical protein
MFLPTTDMAVTSLTSLALEEGVAVGRRRIRCCWKEVDREEVEEVQQAQALY